MDLEPSTSSYDSDIEENTNVRKRKSNNDMELENTKKLNAIENSNEIETVSNTNETAFSVILSTFQNALKKVPKSQLQNLYSQMLREVNTVDEIRQEAQNPEQDVEELQETGQSLPEEVRNNIKQIENPLPSKNKTNEDLQPESSPLSETKSMGVQFSYLKATELENVKSLQCTTISVTKTISKANTKVDSNIKPSNNDQSTSPSQEKNSTPSLEKSSANQKSINFKSHCNLVTTAYPVSNSIWWAENQKQESSAHQNSSEVIDLTQDDDRQTDSKNDTQKFNKNTTRSDTGTNHAQQSQALNEKLANKMPTTSTTATNAARAQNKPVFLGAQPVADSNELMSMLSFNKGNELKINVELYLLNQINRNNILNNLKNLTPLDETAAINQTNRPILKLLPPRPKLSIRKVKEGIFLSWDISLESEHAPISKYELYVYKENDTFPCTSEWTFMSEFEAEPVPMAVSMTEGLSGVKYHFAIRGVDLYSRIGPFSFPCSVVFD